MNINEMINENLIKVGLKAKTKEEAIKELSQLLYANNKIKNVKDFEKDVLARERQMSTVFEDGIVMPHAKSNSVNEASVAIGISKEGIDCNSVDGKKSRVFFVIAMPHNSNDLHVKTLSEITSKLLDDSFKQTLFSAKNKGEVYNLFNEKKKDTDKKRKDGRFLIGVTGCPVGVAHTYIAANALKKYAEEMGVDIKVETNGSVGVENSPTKSEIDKAQAIIIACDRQIDLDRFNGKRVIFAGTKEAINRPKKLIEKALNGDVPVYSSSGKRAYSNNDFSKEKTGLYKYLMNGVSYMIPFVVIGGLLIAISLAIGGKPTPEGLQIPEGSFWNQILNVGVVGFKLMIPILAGYIAYAIGDTPALAPGMIGGWIANDGSFYNAAAGTGFIGAIIAGFIVGYIVKWIKSWSFPKIIQPLVPIMIIPILGSLAIALLFIFVIGAPIASLMDSLVNMLTSLSSGSLVVIGIVIGLMQGFDMGGPFGKVAFMFSVGLIANGQTQFMGAQACAIPVAPLGMAIATFVGRKMKLFNEEELANGKAALAMGLVGISEGAIPFAASDPLAVIPANMIGSAVACVLGFLFGITNNVAHGGPIVAFLGAINNPLLALLAMLIGSLVTAFITIFMKKLISKKRKESVSAA
ncbi:PTS fructose transporter subunit IIABC [Maledivibacter halophilus]|uniref:PTS system IIA component, Fru family (TC 4.A.2)/PTS system IIB component, Fru family (TC 4.A.2)/PTS system IIC component, Fru family (TC 4.A.2) n=1 Tax=Maledivibacter halophilus TaxID=36842 RepID=A0A1T5KJ29_9FIRM|nr:fructose-specific PTS transporter subunit EIIC [Maledivibacter halophilus]SKC63673.1 PTS system IIA component, Fru family (TC 4.A.2)/PTS system IIB component, Fru family (TC 4.A.2)/PTS system IIC component, Fru family (TC 4.A.2) [Maledivibacter halophilus]